MDGWKALVMIVAIVGVLALGAYVFNEIKKAKIMQAQGEAIGNVFKTGGNMVSGLIPHR